MSENATTAKPLTTKQIVAKLRRKEGKTATEIGTTALYMRKLETQGIVCETGKRQTGKRGRPSIEWGLPTE